MAQFIPEFLKKISRSRLLRRPTSWSTLIHWALPVILILYVLVAALFYLSNLNVLNDSADESWSMILAFLSFVCAVVWLVYLLRFNVFKRFGHLPKLYYWRQFLSFTLILGALIFLPTLPQWLLTIQANQKFTSVELADDIDEMNRSILLLNIDKVPKEWRVVNFEVFAGEAGKNGNPYDDGYYDDRHVQEQTRKVSERWMKDFLRDNTDSLIKISNNKYVMYICPDYSFFYQDAANRYLGREWSSDEKLFNDVVLGPKPSQSELNMMGKRLKVLFSKYKSTNPYLSSNYSSEKNWKYRVKPKGFDAADEGIDELIYKKYLFAYGNWKELYLPILMFLTFLSSLLFLFRHNHNKVFFWSLLSGALLFFLSVIILVFTEVHYQDFSLVCGSLISTYLFIFMFLSIRIRSQKNFSLLSSIALNFFTVLIPFIPLMWVRMYYDQLHRRYDSTAVLRNNTEYFALEDLHTELSLLLGVLILFLLIQFFIGPLLKKAYSLPRA